MVDSKAQDGEIRGTGAVGIFLMATVVIILAAWQAFSHFADDMHQENGASLTAINDLKRTLVESHIQERLGDVTLFANRTSTVRLLDPATPAAAREDARRQVMADIGQLMRAYGYYRVFVLDQNLHPVLPGESTELPAPPKLLLSRLMNSGQAELVDLYTDTDNEISFGVTHPILGGADNKKVLGAVFLQVDVRRQLLPFLMHWPTRSRTGESFIVRFNDGKALQLGGNPKLNTSIVQERVAPNDPRRIGTRLQKGETGLMLEAIDRRNQSVIAATARIKGTPWFIVTKMDHEEDEESLKDFGWMIVGLASLILTLAGAMTLMGLKISRQRHAARQIQLTRQYTAAVETAIDGFIRVDSEGRILEANQVVTEMTGYSREELLGMGLEQLDATLTASEVRSALQDMKTGRPVRFNARWKRRDGSIIDLDTNVIYLPEQALFYTYLRDTTESLQMMRKLQRLNAFYVILSRLTESLLGLRDPQDILRTVCIEAAREGRYPLVWVGTLEEASGSIRVDFAEGSHKEAARDLNLSTLASHPGGNGPAGRAWRAQHVVVSNDFLADEKISSGHALASQHGLRSVAVVPILLAGKTVAVLSFNSGEVGHFDDAIQLLMQETARHIALAWEAGAAARQRDEERHQREVVESRYQRIFNSSPVPKQIHSITDARLLAINRAHQQTFGYALEDIATGDDWFAKAYPDERTREDIRSRWLADMQRARETGAIISSPEIQLRCKDGTLRIVRGAMTVADQDAIITWTDLTEIRAREAALRQSEERFLATFQQAAVGIALVDTQGQWLQVNDRLCHILGYEREALLNVPFRSMTHPEDIDTDLKAMKRLLDGSLNNYLREKRYIRKDGTLVWANLSVSLVRRVDGQPDYFISVVEDISARKEADELVGKLSLAVRQSPNTVVITDLDANIEYVNEAFERHTGYTAAEVKGKNPRVLKSGKTPAAIYDEMWASLTAGQPWKGELINKRKDGSEFTEHANIVPLRNTGGVVTHYVAVKEDVTERRKAELALRESEQRFRGMVEETITGFYVVRADRLVYVNPRFAQMVGWEAEELIGRDPLDYLDEESRQRAMASRDRIAAGERTVSYDLNVRRKDGSTVVLGIHGVVGNWDGRRALIAMVEDITERRRTEQRIQETLTRLQASMKGTLEAVARMVDLRDPYTAGHEKRVGLIAADIARELGWDEARARSLELIGLVHDIGKIAVPAELLSKPTRLTRTEYEMIKMHAQAGYDILQDVPFEQPVAEIIRQHHERMDGSGYPQGLKGEQILPEARVLAVADVLESMASHRPYRPALGLPAALEELEHNRATLYDADVVDAVLRLVREKGYSLPA
jgi:PAS domain S-box-containing protein/putative nucleotidyltransferase with HDIG domain